MKIVNNADRTIEVQVQAPGSITVWAGEVSKGASAEKQLSDPHLSCSTQFKTDSPQLAGDLKQGLTGNSTVVISQVYCGVVYAGG